MKEEIRSAVVTGGMGEVGQFFARLLSREAAVTLVDLRAAAPSPVLVDDIRTPGTQLRDLMERADIVVLAVPESVALAAIPVVAASMRRGALLLDTTSVKSSIVPILDKAVTRHELAGVSVNPMFAPTLDPAGRSVAMVEVSPGPGVIHIRELFTQAGAVLVDLTAERHDQLCAAAQAATHASILAFGATIRSMGVELDELLAVAPPPHRTLLGLLARMVSASPEVYRDIQVANPYAVDTRTALHREVGRLGEVTLAPDDFAAYIRDLAQWLGPHREELAAQCAAAFSITPTHARTPAPPSQAS